MATTHVARAHVYQYCNTDECAGHCIGIVFCDGTSANDASPFAPHFDQNKFGISYTYEESGLPVAKVRI